ncbi:MAG: dienelactone hydrolase family protein [Actinomycetota bacterium]|nr:dienelactone hydrolase family protein [Actinomycetota bacterium]MDA2998876.1 dienelactone hydrolase family protein [Actinomycetota bacterium]
MHIAGWDQSSFTHEGVTHPTWRKGTGPVVIVVHEIPGVTPKVIEFAERVVNEGFTVVMPLLVGEVGRGPSGAYIAQSMAKICISREFTTMAMHETSPIISWLRALAQQLHAEVGGIGVGAVGMCFSGGFALGMMVDDIMVAPVLSQPSLPFAIGGSRGADLNLSESDQARLVERAQAGCQVLGLRYTGDKLVGTRFATLRKLLGEAFIAVEFASTSKQDHSVLTEQIQPEAIERVLQFLHDKLK